MIQNTNAYIKQKQENRHMYLQSAGTLGINDNFQDIVFPVMPAVDYESVNHDMSIYSGNASGLNL